MNNKRVRAKADIKEIREMFKSSGIIEAELQDSGRKIRREIVRQLYNEKH